MLHAQPKLARRERPFVTAFHHVNSRRAWPGGSDHGRGDLVLGKESEGAPEREEVRRGEEDDADGAGVAAELPVEGRRGDAVVVVREDLSSRRRRW